MTAYSDEFPWPSYYGHYDFFEERMNRHDRVVSLVAQENGVYELTRTQGDTLRVFICDCYAFGMAQYRETVGLLGHLDAIIINSIWCGYSPDVKKQCREENVGLFMIGDFMAALHRKDYWTYLTDAEKDYFKAQGWW